MSLLSSMTLASLSDIRERARVSRMVNDFEFIESNMAAWVASGRTVEWPVEGQGVLSGMSNPGINEIRDATDLNQYLNPVSKPPYGNSYYYDNDGDQKANCNEIIKGVNIFVDGVSQNIARELDSEIDDSVNLDCGKLRWRSRSSNPDQVLYVLSGDGRL